MKSAHFGEVGRLMPAGEISLFWGTRTMQCFFRSLQLLCLGFVLTGLPAAHAACKSESQTQYNKDGSQMRLMQTRCDTDGDSDAEKEGDSSTFVLSVKPKGSERFRTALTQDALPEGWRTARLRDLEGDGNWVLEVTGTNCGAGPNCQGSIYKPTADRQRVYLFFDGGYAEFLRIPGYYVESGRASCCSWEYHLYTPPAPGKTITQQNFRYRVVVGGTSDETANACVMTDVRREKRVPIRDPHIRKLCKVYD